VLEELLYVPTLTKAQLSQPEEVEKWNQILDSKLQILSESSKTHRYKVSVHYDAERNLHIPHLEVTAHGVPTQIRLSPEFFESSDYRNLRQLGDKLEGLLEPGAYVSKGERKSAVSNFKDALEWIMNESKKGYNIQRYKGLGEMNPEQLWETTMDPGTRRMLKVTVEDTIAADQMFTCLMGDQVEPRRAFIETNALYVANLDV
jgi:DNA gyrase subunit B